MKVEIPEIIKTVGKQYKKEYSRILSAIKRYDRIAIFRHIMPDFDALGTQMGLATWIKDNFKDKEVIVLGDNHVTFTPRLFPEMDRPNDEWFTKPFLGIIVDVSNKSRIADPRFKKAKFKIRLDHHPLVESWGKITVVDTSMAAASELVANMCFNLKGYQMSKEAAYYFYIGLSGDSGNFRFSSVKEHTFAIAGELVKTGLNVSEVYQNMYVKKLEDLYVTKYILSNFSVSEHGVAYYVLDAKTQEELNITTERGKENVNLFSNIEGINAWCSITEDPKDRCWRVSIRSKEKAINDVAAKWEGGGHKQASGAKLNKISELPLFIDDLDSLFR